MATIDRTFVDGLFWRMLLLGALAAVLTGGMISWRFGYSLVLGTAVGAASLRVTAAAVERLMQAVIDGARPNAGWAVLLVLKLVALFVAVAVCLVWLKAHPVAFVIGFKMLLPALGWQAVVHPDPVVGSGEDANDTESR